MMDYTLEDLIDIPLLQNLQDKLNVIYSFPSAIIDINGKILTAVAWQDICTKFHRLHPECEKECIKSDRYIIEHLHEANPAVSYQCPHGLTDNATPIIIDGKHLGTFFTGQFFLETPDPEFFRKQAKIYGFDEKAYLEAVNKVPIWTKEKLNQYLDFIKGFIEIIASLGLKNLKEIEANGIIRENGEEIKKLNRVYSVLSNINQTIVRTRDRQLLFNEACRIAVDDGGFLMAWIGMVNTATNKVDVVASYGKTGDYLNDINIDLSDITLGSGPTGLAMKSGKSSFSNNIATDDHMLPWRERALFLGYRSSITLPLILSGKTVGAYTMYSGETSFFNVQEIKLLIELASDISFALEYVENEKERVQAEEALKKSENEFRLLAEAMPQIVWTTRADGWNTYFNQQWMEYTGLTLEESLGHGWNKPFHPDDQKRAWDAWQDATKNNCTYSLQCRLRRFDGEYKWWLIRGVPVKDSAGTILKWFGTCTDINELLLAEEALRTNNTRLELAMQSANMAWWEMDITTGNVIFDQRKSEMLDFPPEMFRHYKDFMALVHPGDHDKAMDAMRKHLNGSADKYEIEYRILTKSGIYKWFYDIGTVVKKDSEGKPLFIAGLVIDITKRKLAENEIRELNESLEQRVAERTKQLEVLNKELEFHTREIEQFTYIASHDLQEPLRTLTNFTKLIQEDYTGKLDAEGRKYIEFIYNSAGRMRDLVKGLLDYSLLGKESVLTSVDCNKIVADVLVDLTNSIQRNNAIITVRDLPAVNGFPTELRLLFQNLINNAIKFQSKEIHPEIKISAESHDNEWRFSVQDNGIGIEEKDKVNIFIIFKRLHNQTKFEGTGIGLAHCKKIVELHGGRIWVESTPGAGSVFIFTIPKS